MTAKISGGVRRLRDFVAVLLLIPIGIVLMPILLVLGLWESVHGGQVRRAFLAKWRPLGKHGLLVYSNSPNWQAYIERSWLPTLGQHLVILNWSERAGWPAKCPIEAALFHSYAGDRAYNPMAIILGPTSRGRLDAWRRGALLEALRGQPVSIVRFWQALRDFKHGKEGALRRAELAMDRALQAAIAARGGV